MIELPNAAVLWLALPVLAVAVIGLCQLAGFRRWLSGFYIEHWTNSCFWLALPEIAITRYPSFDVGVGFKFAHWEVFLGWCKRSAELGGWTIDIEAGNFWKSIPKVYDFRPGPAQDPEEPSCIKVEEPERELCASCPSPGLCSTHSAACLEWKRWG